MLIKDTELNRVIDKYTDKSNVIISSIGFLNNLFTIVFGLLWITIIYCMTKSWYLLGMISCAFVYKTLKLKSSLFKLSQDFNDLVILLDHIKYFEVSSESVIYFEEILKVAQEFTKSIEKIYT